MRAAATSAALVALGLLGGQTHAQSTAAGYSAANLYNLANSYARAGKPGLAVLNYERAALLAPQDPDIQTNLKHVRASAHLPPETANRAAAITRLASPTAVAWIGVLGVGILGSSLLVGRVSRRFRALRITAAALGIAASCFTVGNAAVQWPKLREGVVIVSDTALRASPIPMGDAMLQLPEAETVTVIAQREDFVLIRTQAGRSGWAPRANIANVIP